MLPEVRAEYVGERGWHGEEVMVVVVRAERCEDNSPKGEICKAGVLYEAGSAWCEGVLCSTPKLKKSSWTLAVSYFRMAADLSFYSAFLHSFCFCSILLIIVAQGRWSAMIRNVTKINALTYLPEFDTKTFPTLKLCSIWCSFSDIILDILWLRQKNKTEKGNKTHRASGCDIFWHIIPLPHSVPIFSKSKYWIFVLFWWKRCF